MSGRRACQINVYVNILVTRADGCSDCFSQLWTGKKCRYLIWASYHFNLRIIKPWSCVRPEHYLGWCIWSVVWEVNATWDMLYVTQCDKGTSTYQVTQNLAFFYPPSLLWHHDDTLVRPLPPYDDRWHLTFSYNYWISLFSAQAWYHIWTLPKAKQRN